MIGTYIEHIFRNLYSKMTPFRSLYIDMNSFYASVEQHENPRLRGRPLEICATEGDSGCVVAASIEAKRKGVKTGMRVKDAREACPGIVFLPSRHRLYVRYNQAIARVLDRHAELERVRSVDEFQIALGGDTATLDGAMMLARRLKQAVAAEISPVTTFSVGLGPNHLLAKIAGKLEKPDGLQWLAPENMPQRIAHLALDDLPGISRGIKQKLLRARIWDIEALYRLDPRHARLIWRSVEGERFVRGLQGENIPLIETQRGGYGQSKVLAPEYRAPAKARLVGRWLTEKATERLRRDGYCAARFSLSMSFWRGSGWGRSIKCAPMQDTAYFLGLYDDLWARMEASFGGIILAGLSVQLGDVLPLAQRTGDLFLPLEPGKPNRPKSLSKAVDHLNRRYGERVVTFGLQQDHPGFFERG